MQKKKRSPILIILGLSFLFFSGVGLLVSQGVDAYEEYRNEYFYHTEATIIGYDMRVEGWSPICRYSYNGITYEETNNHITYGYKPSKTGQSVAILVNPNDPLDFNEAEFSLPVFAIIGWVFLVAGAAMFLLGMKKWPVSEEPFNSLEGADGDTWVDSNNVQRDIRDYTKRRK